MPDQVPSGSTSKSTYVGYRRFYAARPYGRATVSNGSAVIRVWVPSPMLRMSGVPVPLVVPAGEIEQVLAPTGLARHGILVPRRGSPLCPTRVSWWVCEALVPELAAAAAPVGFWEASRMVRGVVSMSRRANELP